jgi:hypothetical protein
MRLGGIIYTGTLGAFRGILGHFGAWWGIAGKIPNIPQQYLNKKRDTISDAPYLKQNDS